VERVVPIYHNQQPRAIAPMKLTIYDELPSPRAPKPSSLRMSSWLGEGRDRSSKLQKRKSLLNGPSSRLSRRQKRTISAPTNFRRVQPARRRVSFRPLELSIYMPGNQLPDLPEFSKFDVEYPSIPSRARDNPYYRRYSDTPSTFTIPRKPVGSLRRKSSPVDNQDAFLGHRSARSESRLSRPATIYRENSRRHNRARSTPIMSPTPRTFPADSTTDGRSHVPSMRYSSRTESSSAFPEFVLADTYRAPMPRSDSLGNWALGSPSGLQTPPTSFSSRGTRSRKPSDSTIISTNTLTAASRRTPSLASSLTSAGTLYQPTPFPEASEKTYEIALDNAMRPKTGNPRYEETYPTIYESEQYHFTPPMSNSPRMVNVNDIGLAF
ncbi:hypothetical protein LOZ03_001133, partial [Ophidiomyces ophidiicola]